MIKDTKNEMGKSTADKIKEIIKNTGVDIDVGDYIQECIRQLGKQWYLRDEVV